MGKLRDSGNELARAFQNGLTGYLIESNEKDATPGVRFVKGKVTVRASSLGGCLRSVWYARDHAPAPKDNTEWVHRMWNGTILHNALTRVIEKILPEPQTKILEKGKKSWEVKLKCGVILTGTPDIVLRWNGIKVVVDFKGLSVWNMDNLLSPRSDLLAHYVYQVRGYLLLTNSTFGLIAARGKETGDMHYKVVFRKDEKINNWCELLTKVLSYRKRDKTPPRGAGQDSGSCMFCPYNEECWGANHEATKGAIELKGEHLQKAKALLGEYGSLQNGMQSAENALGTIKMELRNFHDEVASSSFLVPKVGRSTIVRTVRTTKRISKALETKLIREGKIVLVPHECASLRVTLCKKKSRS